MARTVSIGNQDFEKIRINNNFYIDKTDFIRQWWESYDEVTLITRPRRFGKTLNMSMLEKFFSVKYAGRGDLFEGLSIWQEKSPDQETFSNRDKSACEEIPSGENHKYRSLQGTYPVIFLSFASVKDISFTNARESICRIIEEQYNKNDYLLKSDLLNEKEKAFYQKVSENMTDSTAAASLRSLSDFLSRFYGKKTIILLDEYDTPMQEAYMNGYWNELATFIRNLFNSTFKTNPYLERAIMTGITRISKESIFSDLNNLKVITTTSEKYTDCFGFTEEEVFKALDEFELSSKKQHVKDWYDGFTFGNQKDIYNPWSIINFLDSRKVGLYWANSSSNNLAGKLIREGNTDVKQTFEMLLSGETLSAEIDEQIIYNQLSVKKNAIWSLLLASGYLKVVHVEFIERVGRTYYDLALTNKEVRCMFKAMIQDWFSESSSYNNFIKALLLGDVKAMNTYMNRVTEEMFSSFDTGTRPSAKEPERFYHGFVLGLMVELADQYVITSNRESGFGRYDIMLEPRILPSTYHHVSNGNTSITHDHGSVSSGINSQTTNRPCYDGIIIEFKVQDDDEKDLTATVQAALRQIAEKDYQANLLAKGIPENKIRKYGFAFCGKKVLIGMDSVTTGVKIL